MQTFFTNFGFNPKSDEGFRNIVLGPRKNDKTLYWTILVYVFLSLGIFLRRIVNYPNPTEGINTQFLKIGVIAASFIIGLAILAPLLRVISKYHKGKLSWQHCLTAFSIGFFGDLTFDLLTSKFVSVIK